MFGFLDPRSLVTSPGRVVATFIPIHDLDAAQQIEVTTKSGLQGLMDAFRNQLRDGISHISGEPLADFAGEAFSHEGRMMINGYLNGRPRMLEVDDSLIKGGIPLADAQPVRFMGHVEGDTITVCAATCLPSPLRSPETVLAM